MMDQFMTEFEAYLQTECGYSPATITAYISDITQFKAYLPGALIETSVDQYLTQLYGTVSPTTIRRKQSVLTQFVSFLFHNGRISFQYRPAHRIRQPQRYPTPLSHAQVTQLLAAPNAALDRYYLRDKVLIQWLYGYGVRVSEVAQVTLSQCGPSFIELIGKGRKTRRIARHAAERQDCDAYCNQLRTTLIKNKGENKEDMGFLFLSNRGTSLTRFALYGIVQKYAHRCHIMGVFPHQFRHSFASHLLADGADIYAVQSLLGHASIQTTQGYMQCSDPQKRDIFNRTHPRS